MDELTNESDLKETSGAYSVTISRDEMNLAEFPLAVLSTRINQQVKTLEFRDQIKSRAGEIIEREWIITGADKFGLPTATDDDVLLGLMRLTMDQGFRTRKIFFTRYELLKILRWTTEGRSYSRLTKSLDRLSGVRIKASNAFFDNSSKSFQTRNFGILDAYEINDSRQARAFSNEQPKSFFIWSEVLFDSFSAGFIKKLDLDFYFTLKSSISRRLYRYLDKHFYYRGQIDKPLLTFAFEKLGLSRNYRYVSSVKQQLEPALDELVEKRFLASYSYYGAGIKTMIRMSSAANREDAQVLEANPSKDQRATSKPTTTTHHPQEFRTYVALLVARGISEIQAERLLADKTSQDLRAVRLVVAYYDHLLRAGDKRVSINPTGFLYRAVESPHKFQVPDEFRQRLVSKNIQRKRKEASYSKQTKLQTPRFKAALNSVRKH